MIERISPPSSVVANVKFFLFAPNRHTLRVFTVPPIGPDAVTEALMRAASKLPGATVVPAEIRMNVESDDEKSTYLFGTGGALQFDHPLDQGAMETVAAVVAQELVGSGYGIHDPVDVSTPY